MANSIDVLNLIQSLIKPKADPFDLTPEYMLRSDGSRKGSGYLGPLPNKNGKVSTELSAGVGLNGKEQEIPLLVPSLTKKEIEYLLNNDDPTPEIVDKAVEHAIYRLNAGQSVWKTPSTLDILFPPY